MTSVTGEGPSPGAPPRPRRRMWPKAVGVALLLLGPLLYWFLGRDGPHAFELDLLPPDSSFVLVADVDGILESSMGESLRDTFPEAFSELERTMDHEFGFTPDDVARVVVGGDLSARVPTIIVVFKDSLDEERVETIARALAIGTTPPRKSHGRRIWGREGGWVSLCWVRGSVLAFGAPQEIDRVARAAGEGRRCKLARLLLAQTDHDASIALALDWTAAGPLRRQLEREFKPFAPVLLLNVGPAVAQASVGRDIEVSTMALDTAERVVASLSGKLDGEFVRARLGDLHRLMLSRTASGEPPPRAADPTFEPAPEPPPAHTAATAAAPDEKAPTPR